MLSRLKVISFEKSPMRIRRLGLGTMTTLNKNWVVGIARRVSRSFNLHPRCKLEFHPPRIGTTRRVEHQDLNLREVFQAPRLTPLALSVVRTIRASVLQEKKDVLDVVSLVTG